MFKKIISTLLILTALSLVSTLLAAKQLPQDTVLAEFDGQTITVADIDARLNQIPSMYRSKFNSEQGKAKLLDMLCTEELFYLEAVNQGLENNPEVQLRMKPQIGTIFAKELRTEIASKDFKITEEEKKEYYNNHLDQFQNKTFEEAAAYIDRKIRSEKAQNIIEKTKNEIITKYNIKVNLSIVDSLNLEELDKNDKFREQYIITGDLPEFQQRVIDIFSYYNILPKQTRDANKTPENFKALVNSMLELEIITVAGKEKGLDKKPEIQQLLAKVKRNTLMQTIYNRMIVDKIDITEKDIKEYYNKNIEKFSSKANRTIQQFVFDTPQTAKEIRKQVKKALRKDNEEQINEIITQHSLSTADNGILQHIYNNGIIPGIGKDEVYSKMVWNTKPGKLSKIFQNSRGEYVFFHITEDNQAVPDDYEIVKPKIMSALQKTLSKEKFDMVTKHLETKYDLKKYPERLIVKLSPEEYFEMAEKAQKSHRLNDAIFYYDKVIKQYPDNVNDYKALFMKAFLYAEELNDKEKALETFKQVINNYPEGDLHESARFMINELNNPDNIPEQFKTDANQ